MAKRDDGVWSAAVVVDVLDSSFTVMFDADHSVESLPVEHVIPTGNDN